MKVWGQTKLTASAKAEVRKARALAKAAAKKARTGRKTAPAGTSMKIPNKVWLEIAKIGGKKAPSGSKAGPAGAFEYELRVGGRKFSVASTGALSKRNFDVMKIAATNPEAMQDQMGILGITSVKGPGGKKITPEQLLSQLQKGSIQLIAKNDAAIKAARKRR
jgi:hypothetical protein